MNLWNPQCADDVSPSSILRTFECSSYGAVGAETTLHGATGRVQTPSAQPLTFGNIGNSVALLVNSQIAHVAEEDNVAIVTFGVLADIAFLG